MSRRGLVELSHVVRAGMVTYPGLPGPEVSDYLSREDSRARYAPGTEFQLGRISLVSNTGTYLDTPFHRFADGADLAMFPLERCVDVSGIVIDATTTGRAIDVAEFEHAGHDVTGRAVLLRTDWSRHWGSERYGASDHPFVTAAAAAWLAEHEPALVGIDSVNIDDMADGARPAHTTLLAAGIPVVEHLRGLDELPPRGFRLHAAPLAIDGMGTFPIRAYALLDEPEVDDSTAS
jgi:kynurenine formamidase